MRITARGQIEAVVIEGEAEECLAAVGLLSSRKAEAECRPDLGSCDGCPNECSPALRAEVAPQAEHVVDLKAEIERLRVGLAVCGAAAQGATGEGQTVKRGDWGWSPAYQDVLALRRRHDAMLKERNEQAEVYRTRYNEFFQRVAEAVEEDMAPGMEDLLLYVIEGLASGLPGALHRGQRHEIKRLTEENQRLQQQIAALFAVEGGAA